MLKTKFSFHGQKVDASLSQSSNSIEILLSVKGREYRNLFTQEYIENMTAKTGNFKKFKIFSEMIISGFKGQDDTIKIEILTLKDLQKNSDGGQTLDDKLYLILTYSVAFDRVHYPLPLMLEKSVEQELQEKLEESEKSRLDTVQELSLMMRENDRLKHLLKSKEESPINQNMILPDSDGYAIQERLLTISKALGTSVTNRSCHHYQIHSELVLIVDQLIGRFKYLKPTGKSALRSLSTDRNISKPNTTGSKSRPRSLSLTPTSKPNLKSKSIPPKSNSTRKYVPLKSEPLKKGLESMKRQTSISRLNLGPATPSFTRFDPTKYVQEREAKLERRRSLSRESRSNSLTRSLSQTRKPEWGSRPQSVERNGRKRLELSKERPRTKPSTARDRGSDRALDSSIGARESRQNRFAARPKVPPKEYDYQELEHSSDPAHDMIDQRLANLQEYLQNALL